MDLEEHAQLVGRLVGNLQSLEFALRAYLYEKKSPPHAPFASGQSLHSFNVGDIVPENAMTDYSTLGKLIERYNQGVEARFQVDSSIVSVRDALAHGRVSALDPAQDLVLLKFEKPSGGLTKVTYAQALTADWLKSQTTRIFGEIQKICKASGSSMSLGS